MEALDLGEKCRQETQEGEHAKRDGGAGAGSQKSRGIAGSPRQGGGVGLERQWFSNQESQKPQGQGTHSSKIPK